MRKKKKSDTVKIWRVEHENETGGCFTRYFPLEARAEAHRIELMANGYDNIDVRVFELEFSKQGVCDALTNWPLE